jgi:hypothetical protein
MDIDFSEAEAYATDWHEEHVAIFYTFQSLLRASGDDNSSSSAVETTATAMANVIRQAAWQGSDHAPVDACWDNLVNMVEEIPLHHPWHAIFVRTIHILHGLVGEPVYSVPGYFSTATWDGLASLQYHFWDFWDGRSMIYLEAGPGSPEKDVKVLQWKRWISMFAQMPAFIALPYYIMRAIQPLESPPPIDADPVDAACTLWTACEWFIHRAYQALECLRAHAIDKDEYLGMGELYRRDVGDPCSLERWDWWKHRLQELAFDVDAETKQHVVMALASMAAAEARPSKVEELDREEKRKEKEKEEKERKEEGEKREEEGKEEKQEGEKEEKKNK